ncbi:hypothetical protein A2482_05335 [Candidatus Falkowbacteria bacterium RIFOXYC2_FULL_48_21]|uniref:Uncharacterized protein n=1 Tax=Candidatus Falkowbacteria bacterium RIFOXYC2_FULL_48_21 TaxID=1798005 RepID=A0A1F5T8K2_9BACT|nr:MAG: hypothetical protein A2482_05335 [Candidatus Falkowbacteria bacterium RIFOXYC2_FULL_48_21]
MLNQEQIAPTDQKRQLSEAEMKTLLAGDYPPQAGSYILSMLMLLNDGALDESDFYSTVRPNQVKTVEEYLTRYSQSRGVKIPRVSAELQTKFDEINRQVAALRQALIDRAPLSQIYNLSRDLSLFCGAHPPRIPSLEQ